MLNFNLILNVVTGIFAYKIIIGSLTLVLHLIRIKLEADIKRFEQIEKEQAKRKEELHNCWKELYSDKKQGK